MFNSQSNTPPSDPQRLVSDYAFSCLVTAFLNELDNDERNELRAAAARFVAACAEDVPADEARQFFYNACPGFHAFSEYWYGLPCYERYSNVGHDTLYGWERAAAACHGRTVRRG